MDVAKKIVIGMVAFAMLCAIAGAGYSFGKRLSLQDKHASTRATPAA